MQKNQYFQNFKKNYLVNIGLSTLKNLIFCVFEIFWLTCSLDIANLVGQLKINFGQNVIFEIKIVSNRCKMKHKRSMDLVRIFINMLTDYRTMKDHPKSDKNFDPSRNSGNNSGSPLF
jgi:hypothetical protein